MKHAGKIIAFFLLQTAFVTSLLAGLVPNPGFEDGTDGYLGAWKLFGTEPIPEKGELVCKEGVRVAWETGSGSGGRHCLRMSDQGRAEGDYALVSSSRFPLLPGYEYEASLRFRAEGLMPESADRKHYAALIMDIFFESTKRHVGGTRIMSFNNSADWASLSKKFMVPEGARWGQVRLQLVNQYPNSKATIWWDDLAITPLDPSPRNSGFEELDVDDLPQDWSAVGAAKTAVVESPAHQGTRAVSVTDAPDGLFAGWTQVIPVRGDRLYRFSGFAKGGDLKPNGFIGGGALAIQFLDSDGQAIGKPTLSPAVGARTDWTEISTPKIESPTGAVAARLTAGMQYCNGTAWFDDLALAVDVAETHNAVRIQRIPKPAEGIRFATNLLANGDMENGADGKPANWNYVGKSDPNWTTDEIKRLHTDGRPPFAMGRGKGEWSHDVVYAGRGALLNISIDPPLSANHQWSGRSPVDGYWRSDPMPCEAGKAYLAGGWIRPGAPISEAWYGPLEIQFFDQQNRQLRPRNDPVRCALGDAPAGVWTYWATAPYITPPGAVAMRLRFGQEFAADRAGWGRSYADNLAVWRVPAEADLSVIQELVLDTCRFREWFIRAHTQTKPPYLPSPADAAEYGSCWGTLENAVVGNVFHDAEAPVSLRLKLFNLLGEDRRIGVHVLRTDWLGNADPVIALPESNLRGSSEGTIPLTLPPVKRYGSFHLEVLVYEGLARVGQFSGRYAVLPPLGRPRTAENIWGITPLYPIHGDGRPFEQEMGTMMKTAGFGVSWIRMHFNLDPAQCDATIRETLKVVDWYRSLGIRPVLQLMPEWKRPVNRAEYEAAGRRIGEAFKGRVAAIGNHGIEQANSASPYRGGGAIRLTDGEYDTILAGLYDGIKAADSKQTVLIGNIATDREGKTVRRLYDKPAEGRFDGAILNAYMGLVMTAQNNLAEFDRHGDKQKTIWQEENADQRSPAAGESRRYGEGDGARNMVRSWLSMACQCHPRIKAMTFWGLIGRSDDEDIPMLNAALQPRPQFVAHAVMADALADAQYVGDRSEGDATIFEWKRDGEAFLALWANAGERELTLEAPIDQPDFLRKLRALFGGQLAVPELKLMDLMGNCQVLKTSNGLISVKLTTTPVYLYGTRSITVSKRLEARLTHGDTKAGQPCIALTLKNNDAMLVGGNVVFRGEIIGPSELPFILKPAESTRLIVPVRKDLNPGKPSTFRAECRVSTGATFTATASLNFAQAVRTARPPTLDGQWDEWVAAPVIPFGELWQVVQPRGPDERYNGPGDISGKIRLLWDDRFLYLGVEALDDVFLAQPERGMDGFMGDSIEFGVQPGNLRAPTAPYWEYEMHLPGGKGAYAASRRFPLPAAMVDKWLASVTPTGVRGHVNYQAAIPWADLGIRSVKTGQTFSMAVMLNDADVPDRFSRGRCRIRWFEGIDGTKNPENFGDVTLVEP